MVKDDGAIPVVLSGFVGLDDGSCGLPPDRPFEGMVIGGFLEEGEIRFKLVVELFRRSISGIMGFLCGAPIGLPGSLPWVKLSRTILMSGGIGTE